MDKDLVKKIKQLKKIQPSAKWLDLTRSDLTNQLFEEDNSRVWIIGFQPMALVICLLVIFIGGPWMTLKASQSSLPGEILYSIKKASESVQKIVASEDNKAQLQVEFAGRRMEELTKITENSFSEEEKTEKVKQLVSDLKDDLSEANNHVDAISREKAVAIAEKTKKIKEELNRTKEEAPLDAQNDLAEAEKAVEEINDQILAVLIEKGQDSVEETASSTPDQETLIFLEETDSGTITTTKEIIHN